MATKPTVLYDDPNRQNESKDVLTMLKQLIGIVTVLALCGPVAAADIGAGAQCIQSGPGQLISIENNAELTTEVVTLMTDAVNVADSDEWIDSRAPAFTWASEAKVACGKAYGYLQTGYRDDDTINKCECFHGRMRQSMY
jgi:hypothetical protein